MYEVGRLCVKLAGRDAGLKCVIVEILDNNFVMIDGQTRRRKCNVKHLEPLKEVVKIEKGASNVAICSALNKLKIECAEKKEKAVEDKKENKGRTKKVKKVKEKRPKKEKKPKTKKKETKKEEKPAQKKKAKAEKKQEESKAEKTEKLTKAEKPKTVEKTAAKTDKKETKK